RVMRSIWERGSDALSFRTRHLVAAGGEAVETQVGEHPQVVVLGDRVAGEQDDIHRGTALNGPPPMPCSHVTSWVLLSCLANDSGLPSRSCHSPSMMPILAS